MDQRMMVKQWVGEIETERGERFRVFETGDAKFYLFDPIDAHGCSRCMQFPVLKRRLRRGAIGDGLARRVRSMMEGAA